MIGVDESNQHRYLLLEEEIQELRSDKVELVEDNTNKEGKIKNLMHANLQLQTQVTSMEH